MDDIKFERCRDFLRVSTPTKRSEYSLIANAFTDSMERINFLAELPAEVIYWSQYFAIFVHIASEQLGVANGEKVSEEVIERANTELQKFIKRRNDRYKNNRALIDAHQWEVGSTNFASFMRSDHSGQLRKSAQALFASMLVSGWAALETLCIDLWVAALNSHPKTLGMRAVKNTNNQKISLDELAGMDFDLSSCIGEFLYRGKKINLDKFKYVRDAYKHAFGEDWPDIFANYPKLKAAETLRHLFAHRSGRIDRQFMDRCTPDMIAELSPNIGQVIEMNGDFVSDCIDSCAKCGAELLIFVDEWSAKNG